MTISRLHAEARAFAELGLRIFPCWPGTKIPATPNGYLDASADVEQIDDWWGEHPNLNVAMCPDHNGWCVVDLDQPKNNDMQSGLAGWDLLQLEHDVPPTFTTRTPRGGRHLFFAGSIPSSVGTQKKGLLPGYAIDTRGAGGYVLLPPSVFEGREYVIENDIDAAPLPSWVGVALANATRPVESAPHVPDDGGNVARARTYLRDLAGRGRASAPGSRNAETYVRACDLRDLGLSAPTALDLLLTEWLPHVGQTVEDPFTEAEVRTTLESAYKTAQNGAGAYAAGSAADTFAGALAQLPATVERSKWHFETADEMEVEDPVEWLVPGLLPAKSTVMLAGASGSFKSYLALELGLAVATGRETFGVQPQQGPVVYAVMEGRRSIRGPRRRAWCLKAGIDPKDVKDFRVGRGPLIIHQEDVQAWGDTIAAEIGKPKLIILDTTVKIAAGLELNDGRDATRVTAFADSLVEHFGCTVLMLHHVGKDDSRGPMGSAYLKANVDSLIVVQRQGKHRVVQVTVDKHKDAPEPEAPFYLEGKPLAGDLVFEIIDAGRAKEITEGEDPIQPTKVGAALRRLGQPVMANVLASELVNALPNENVEDRLAAVKRMEKMLAKASKDRLAGYVAAGMWSLPG